MTWRALQFIFLLALSTPVGAQFGVPWRYSPEILVFGTNARDTRFEAVDEAIEFWNKMLTEVGSSFRLASARRVVVPTTPDDALRTLSELMLRGPVSPGFIPDTLINLPGDLRIVLTDANLVSFAGPFDGNLRRVVAIRTGRGPPMNLPNVARNLLAHEIGHAIGMGHNADFSALMCGRPAACRPDQFRSNENRFFPLLHREKGTLLELYPANWSPSLKRNNNL